MKKKKTMVIFGVSSFVGSSLAEFFKNDYRVIGTYNTHPVRIPGVLSIHCDVLSRDSVQLMLFTFMPEITIYAVGLKSIADCEEYQKYADALNTVGILNVTTFSERYKAKVVYISSAYIFPGMKKKYNEHDPPDPTTMYGKTKAAAEFFIQKSCLNYLVFRCGVLYGRSIVPNQRTLFEMIQEKMFLSESFNADSNIFTGFLDVYYLAAVLKLCLDNNLQNRLFQVTSLDIMDHYNFALTYADVFKHNKSLIQKGKWPFPENASAPALMDMVGSERFFEMNVLTVEGILNVTLPTVEESLEFTKRRFGGVVGVGKRKQKSGGIEYI